MQQECWIVAWRNLPQVGWNDGSCCARAIGRFRAGRGLRYTKGAYLLLTYSAVGAGRALDAHAVVELLGCDRATIVGIDETEIP